MATRAVRRPTKEAIGTIAPMVVGTVNFMVVTTFGAECGLTDLEGKLLIPSVQRTLERMPAQAATRAAIIIDPLVILTVIIMWGKRIASIKAEQARQKYAVQPQEAARAAGVTGTTYDVHANGTVMNGQTAEQAPNNPTAAQVPDSIRSAFSDV